MPRNKYGTLYYTKEQYERAAYESSALEYAQAQGYDLVKKGSYYHLREHDSMVFTQNGRWFWNSRGVHGGAIEFQIYYEGKTITEAVLTLTEDMERSSYRPKAPKTPQETPEKPKEFVLPERSKDFRRLFGYLCQTRGLDKAVVMEMLQQKILYEGVNRKKGLEFHNAVFVRYDPEGKPVGAFQRGLNPKAPFRGDVEASSKRYGWLLKGGPGAQCVCVFEAAIDAASHLCLTRTKEVDRLSLDGVTLEGKVPEALQNYLAANPQNKGVMLMLDADEAGQRAAANIQRELTRQGHSVMIVPPSHGKDYNDELLYERSRQQAVQPKTFSEQVDRALEGTLNPRNALLVSQTTEIMQRIGMEDLPVLMTQQHLKNILTPEDSGHVEHHGLTREQVLDLPEILKAPAIVLDSWTRADAVIFVSDYTDNAGRPMIAVVRPSGQGTYNLTRMPSNFILSLYGRDGFQRFLEIGVSNDAVLYADREKCRSLSRQTGVQFPSGFERTGYNCIIHGSRNLVKPEIPEQPMAANITPELEPDLEL